MNRYEEIFWGAVGVVVQILGWLLCLALLFLMVTVVVAAARGLWPGFIDLLRQAYG